jgi:hypothetical protein
MNCLTKSSAFLSDLSLADLTNRYAQLESKQQLIFNRSITVVKIFCADIIKIEMRLPKLIGDLDLNVLAAALTAFNSRTPLTISKGLRFVPSEAPVSVMVKRVRSWPVERTGTFLAPFSAMVRPLFGYSQNFHRFFLK